MKRLLSIAIHAAANPMHDAAQTHDLRPQHINQISAHAHMRVRVHVDDIHGHRGGV
jgi:hypothetical protein